MSAWLFVIGDTTALDWVVDHKRMAFRDHIRQTSLLRKGDRCVFYVTRGAFHNPTRDRARVFAVGEITSGLDTKPVEIAGETFNKSVRFKFHREPVPARDGMEFKPLIDRMGFINKPETWHAYLRKALVQISDKDFATLDKALAKYEGQLATSSR
ncbi:MAG TPA: hypothetical protein VHA73_14430 [Acidimicrobiales bacterium]|nr:hypothetical protein [Acidimicrobiales bacterium]